MHFAQSRYLSVLILVNKIFYMYEIKVRVKCCVFLIFASYLEVVELLTQIHCLEERKEELTFHVKNSAAEKKRHEVSQALKDDQSKNILLAG